MSTQVANRTMTGKSSELVLEDVDDLHQIIRPTATSMISLESDLIGNGTHTNPRRGTRMLAAPRNHLLTPSILDYCREVSIIGMRHITQPTSSISQRLIWIVLMLMGAAFATYQIQDQVSEYLSWPTNVRNRVKLLTSMRFPTVTICNENRAKKSAADKYNLTRVLQKVYNLMMESTINTSSLLGVSTADNPRWEDVYLKLSHTAEDTFIWAFYDGNQLRFSDIITNPTDMGYCFTFNSGAFNYTSVRAGSLNGLYVILNVSESEYLFPNDASIGFRVLLHDTLDAPRMLQKGYLIPPGFLTKLEILASETVRLPTPYSDMDCIEADDYSLSACQRDCIALKVIEKCRCKDIYMPGNASVCGPKELVSCVTPYSLSQTPYACDCLPKCSTLSYNYGLSLAPISNTFLSTFGFKANLKDIIVVQVYYTAIQETLIEYTPAFSTMSLWCNGGGALSLVLGSTLLTIVELMELAGMWFYRVIALRFIRK